MKLSFKHSDSTYGSNILRKTNFLQENMAKFLQR
jgi:hypothetical protein